MSLLISILSFGLILVCLLLGLLILIQLPKKEAGLGAAFGADATAALFGAGSGNALTNITKWCAGIFLALCMLISGLTAHNQNSKSKGVIESLKKPDAIVPGSTKALPAVSNTMSVPAPASPVPASAAPTTPAPAAAKPAAPAAPEKK